jgi:hypothetical protein
MKPNDAGIMIGLARASYELENFGTARDYLERVRRIDADMEGRYEYILLRGESSSRASGILTGRRQMEWSE